MFEGVLFYIAPNASSSLEPNGESVVSILTSGNGKETKRITNDTTHIICNQLDFSRLRELVSDDAFCYYVIPKWVLISQSLHYRLPTVRFGFLVMRDQRCYSADPFHFFSGFVFYFYNCPASVLPLYLPLCTHRGAQVVLCCLFHCQVVASLVSQCTHIIVFGNQPYSLPPFLSLYPHIRIVGESWLECCIKSESVIDDTPFLLRPLSEEKRLSQSGDSQKDSPSLPDESYAITWEKDISESIHQLFSGVDVSHVLEVHSHLSSFLERAHPLPPQPRPVCLYPLLHP